MSSNAGFRPEELNRRAFQRTAALTIDKQAEAIGKTREFMADLAARMNKAESRLSLLDADRRRFEQQPWYARLRWLVTGR